jgi:hypothetical protein
VNIDAFRRALLVRQAEAVRCARARLRGAPSDESRLDELDADLFSVEETARAAGEFVQEEPESRALASARSRLAILLDEGPLARLRPLDRAIEAALGRERHEEALELGAERLDALAKEGSRSLESKPDDAPPSEPKTLRSLGALVRGESTSAFVRGARVLLAESAPLAEMVAGWGMGGSGRGLDGMPTRGSRPDGFAGSIERHIDGVLASWCGPSPPLPFSSIVPALRELGSDLGIDPRAEIEIVPVARRAASTVLEADPPSEIVLGLPERDGLDALLAALSAWGAAAAGHLRAGSLSEEHRLHADRALGAGAGALMATLAPEHAFWRREPIPARRRTLARAIASARVAAALFLDRDRVLSGEGERSDGETGAIAEASLGRVRPPASPPTPREPVFAALDLLRGLLLTPHLRERLRTRFGNLWYRERGAGRFLREACEPGGSLTIAQILAGFSLPAPTAESLVDSWRDEIKRLR